MKAARAQEMTDDHVSFALRSKCLQGVNTTFLADWRPAGSEIARQQEPPRRRPIVAQRDIEVEFGQRRLAEAYFPKLDFRRGSGRFHFSKILNQQRPIILVTNNRRSDPSQIEIQRGPRPELFL